jgi:multiple sugar transport system permease protein
MAAATARRPPLTRGALWGYVFIAPYLLFFAAFHVLPTLAAFYLSTQRWRGGDTIYVGLANFAAMLGDQRFWAALKNTFTYAVVMTPLAIVVALLTAAAISSLPWARLRQSYMAAFYLPGVISIVAVSQVWRYLYNREYGFIDYLLTLIGVEPINFLGDPRTALPAVILMHLFTGVGGGIIIFVAAIGGIPVELHDAARIDGARWWQVLTRITLPLLTPVILYLGVLTTIGTFQVFGQIYLMTQGGPSNSTMTVGYLIYQEIFQFYELGVGAAVGLVLLFIILAFSIVQFRWFRAVVEY